MQFISVPYLLCKAYIWISVLLLHLLSNHHRFSCCFVAAVPPSVFRVIVGNDIGSLLFQLTSLSVRHFTPDCQLKFPDYGLQIPAVS